MGNMNLKTAAEKCAKEFTITYADEQGSTEKIWVRTRTQAETEAAFNETTERRLAIREKYKKDSPFYRLLVSEAEMLTIEELAGNATMLEYEDIARKAEAKAPKLVPLDVSKYSSKSAKLKAEEEFEERFKERGDILETLIRELTEERQKALMSEPTDKLIDMICRVRAQYIIAQETQKVLEDYEILDCIRLGGDHSKRYFEDISEIPETPQVRDMLIDAINQVDAITPLEIKN